MQSYLLNIPANLSGSIPVTTPQGNNDKLSYSWINIINSSSSIIVIQTNIGQNVVIIPKGTNMSIPIINDMNYSFVVNYTNVSQIPGETVLFMFDHVSYNYNSQFTNVISLNVTGTIPILAQSQKFTIPINVPLSRVAYASFNMVNAITSYGVQTIRVAMDNFTVASFPANTFGFFTAYGTGEVIQGSMALGVTQIETTRTSLYTATFIVNPI